MAVANNEIVTGFELVQGRPGRPTISVGVVSLCGRCGALVAPGFETTHAGEHTAGFPTNTPSVRAARGTFEANSP